MRKHSFASYKQEFPILLFVYLFIFLCSLFVSAINNIVDCLRTLYGTIWKTFWKQYFLNAGLEDAIGNNTLHYDALSTLKLLKAFERFEKAVSPVLPKTIVFSFVR